MLRPPGSARSPGPAAPPPAHPHTEPRRAAAGAGAGAGPAVAAAAAGYHGNPGPAAAAARAGRPLRPPGGGLGGGTWPGGAGAGLGRRGAEGGARPGRGGAAAGPRLPARPPAPGLRGDALGQRRSGGGGAGGAARGAGESHPHPTPGPGRGSPSRGRRRPRSPGGVVPARPAGGSRTKHGQLAGPSRPGVHVGAAPLLATSCQARPSLRAFFRRGQALPRVRIGAGLVTRLEPMRLPTSRRGPPDVRLERPGSLRGAKTSAGVPPTPDQPLGWRGDLSHKTLVNLLQDPRKSLRTLSQRDREAGQSTTERRKRANPRGCHVDNPNPNPEHSARH